MLMIQLTHLAPDPRSANVMSNERLTKLKANINHLGQCPALIVRPHPKKKEHYILIDGHQRLRALQDIGWTEAPCECWDVDEKQSGLLLATLNRLRGEDHPRKRAVLIEELLTQFDKSQLAELVPENQAQIDDLLLLLKQEDQAIQDVVNAYQEREKQNLPEVLTFVLSQEDAQRVKDVLNRRDANNYNQALVLLCQEVDENDHVER